MAQGAGCELAGELTANDQIVGLEVPGPEEAGDGPAILEIGLARAELRLKCVAFQACFPVADPPEEAPGVTEIVLKFQLVPKHFCLDRHRLAHEDIAR